MKYFILQVLNLFAGQDSKVCAGTKRLCLSNSNLNHEGSAGGARGSSAI